MGLSSMEKIWNKAFFLRARIISVICYKIGNWRIRQFIKPQLTLGINRFPYDSLSITMKTGYAVSAFFAGVKKIVLTFQTQSYAPWNVLGSGSALF